MKKYFKQIRFIAEGYKNFIGSASIKDREKWADLVWDQLQATYKAIGGVKGSGFSSKQDMITTIPMWKIYTEGEELLVVIMYKDKAGRKLVAASTNGTTRAKNILETIIFQGLKTGWSEQSKAILNFVMVNIGLAKIKPYLINVDEVKRSIKDNSVQRVTPELLSTLGPRDKHVYTKFKKELDEYFYVREIGGQLFLKVAMGTLGKFIK